MIAIVVRLVRISSTLTLLYEKVFILHMPRVQGFGAAGSYVSVYHDIRRP